MLAYCIRQSRPGDPASARPQTPFAPPARTPLRRFLARIKAATVLAGLALSGQGCESHGGGASVAPVLDDTGRGFAADPPRERIVSLVPAVTEMLLAIGAGDRLIARTRYDTDARIAALPSVGGGLDPGIEALVQLRPDLVIAWPDRGSRSLAVVLGRLGIPVYGAEVQTFADIRRHTRNLGALAGAADAANQLVAEVDSALVALERRLRGTARRSVYFVVGYNPPRTTGPRTFVDSLVAVAGARNVFADLGSGWPVVSLEEIVRRDPDYLIVTGESGSSMEDLPGWRDLTAVRKGRVLSVDGNLFGRPGPRVAEAAEWLARQLHPERFP